MEQELENESSAIVEVSKAQKVVLSGFGSYEVRFKAPRKGRNPHTGDSFILRARKVVKFKPSKPLRRTMNGQQVTAEDEADEDGDNSDIDTPAKEWLLEQLKDLDFAAGYITAAIEEGEAAFLVAVRDVVEAQDVTRLTRFVLPSFRDTALVRETAVTCTIHHPASLAS